MRGLRVFVVLFSLAVAGTAVAATESQRSSTGFFESHVIHDSHGVFKATMVAREGTYLVNGKAVFADDCASFKGLAEQIARITQQKGLGLRTSAERC